MIFLSYTWRDQLVAHAVDRQLRLAGFEVWIDHRNLRLDTDILEQVDRAIQRCELFVAVKPGRQAGSPWMRTEETIARAYGKAIVSFPAASQAFASPVAAASWTVAAVEARHSRRINVSAHQMRGLGLAS